jgi:DNA processing protein
MTDTPIERANKDSGKIFLQPGIFCLTKVLIRKEDFIMTEEQVLLYRIALTLIPGIGDVQGKRLVAYCGGPEAVFKERKKNLLKVPGIGEYLAGSIARREIFLRAEKEIVFITQYGIPPLFYLDPPYPERLRHCEDGPMMLYLKGAADLSRMRVLSVVGTRKPTDYGKAMCQQIIQGLADQEVLIVSGLAYGVDTIAHRSALANGLPTVGVLAHGLDMIYPYINRPLAEKMVPDGGVLTEFLSGTKLNRDYFPRRNRIIAGIADATLVIESAEKGGALITADIANSYNRDVFALPGRVTDEKSSGCNALIRMNKAALVQSAADICFLMGWDRSGAQVHAQQRLFLEMDEAEKKIYEILQQKQEADIDEIYLASGMTPSKVASVLLKLEFEGLVRTLPGKRFRFSS